MNVKEALSELRKGKKRKFSQSIDLLINLKGFDLRRDSVNVVINVPHKIKDKKVCGFFEKRSSLISSVTKPEFSKYRDKVALKKLVKEYDFFVAIGSLMPAVATTFGKVLGPAGKMPSPQLGILPNDSEVEIKKVIERVSKSVKIRTKEASVKLSIGTDKMKDEEIAENVAAVYKGIVSALPKKVDNVKNVMLKSTMSKPLKMEIK
jgi:large subunit ribosomal protein L1